MYVEGYWCGMRLEHGVNFKKKNVHYNCMKKKLGTFGFINRKV